MIKSRTGLSHSEAGKLGAEKTREILQQKREKKIEEYNKHPTCCKQCGKPFEYKRRKAKFCNQSCAAKYNNTGRKQTEETKQKIRNTNTTRVYKSNRKKKIKYCKMCGAEKGKCKLPEICKLYKCVTGSLIPSFGFDVSTIGTEKYYDEFDRIKTIFIEKYWNEGLTLEEVLAVFPDCKKDASGLKKLFNSMGIKNRTAKEAIDNYINKHIENNNIAFPNFFSQQSTHTTFQQGWHTTWNNIDIFYRSSYELEFAKQLDEQKINYQVESLRIVYYDTQRQTERVAIPDFYIPETNEIYEIKGYNWKAEETKQNMRDKFSEYISRGYTPHLIIKNDITNKLEEIKNF